MFMAHILLWSREETGLKYLAVECGFDGRTWRLSMKVGDLVKYKGILGIVTAPCIKRWAKSGDVWVLWSNRNKPIVECSGFMELVNESR
jgi:hypothetical protein